MDSGQQQNVENGEWRRDPTGRNSFRLWDGNAWTDSVSNHGVRAIDPMTPVDRTAQPTNAGSHPAAIPLPQAAGSPQSGGSGKFGFDHHGPSSSAAKTFGGVLVLVGAVLAAVGTLMPIYDRVPSGETYLDTSNGLWTALIAVAMAFVGLLGILRSQSSRSPAVGALLLSIPMLAIVIPDYRTVERAIGFQWDSGLTLCLADSSRGAKPLTLVNRVR